ncbi:MAG: 4,5-DOPA dioxygenase extradiol [Mangrovicoccus sp.]
MSVVTSLQNLKDGLAASDRMPVLFLGHGSPMNAIEDTVYSRSWTELGESLPRPQAILVVSAHWMSRGAVLVNVAQTPETIHDFYGFPPELFAQQYPAPGAPEMAREVASLLASHKSMETDRWGLDHGAWAVLKFLFPKADVPVFQLSIDMTRDLPEHVAIGKTLAELRHRGVLIIGSGNIVHNLAAMDFHAKPYDWAIEFDQIFAERLADGDLTAISDRKALGRLLDAAHPSLEHYLPALTIAGAADPRDSLLFMTESIDIASVSMRSFIYY